MNLLQRICRQTFHKKLKELNLRDCLTNESKLSFMHGETSLKITWQIERTCPMNLKPQCGFMINPKSDSANQMPP